MRTRSRWRGRPRQTLRSAPQPASTGRTTGRHRLSRSGACAAYSALYIIAITRLRHHEPTRRYAQRGTAEGLSKREIIGCLPQRNIVREIYPALPSSMTAAPRVAEAA